MVGLLEEERRSWCQKQPVGAAKPGFSGSVLPGHAAPRCALTLLSTSIPLYPTLAAPMTPVGPAGAPVLFASTALRLELANFVALELFFELMFRNGGREHGKPAPEQPGEQPGPPSTTDLGWTKGQRRSRSSRPAMHPARGAHVRYTERCTISVQSRCPVLHALFLLSSWPLQEGAKASTGSVRCPRGFDLGSYEAHPLQSPLSGPRGPRTANESPPSDLSTEAILSPCIQNLGRSVQTFFIDRSSTGASAVAHLCPPCDLTSGFRFHNGQNYLGHWIH